MTQVRQALARGYCHAPNTSKLVDIDLLEAMAKEIIDSFSGEERAMVFDPRETQQDRRIPWDKDMLRAAREEPPACEQTPPQPCTAIPQGQAVSPLLTFNTEPRDTMITANQVEMFLRHHMPDSRDDAVYFERDLHMLVRTIYREAQAPLLENMRLMAMRAAEPSRIMAPNEGCVQSAREPGPIR
jgi:hypothetical protein